MVLFQNTSKVMSFAFSVPVLWQLVNLHFEANFQGSTYFRGKTVALNGRGRKL